MWWTTLRFAGLPSAALTHTSCLKPGSTIKYLYSTTPVAGILNGLGILTTRSGFGIRQPSANVAGGGSCDLSPSGQPFSIQSAIICFSALDMGASLEKSPY